MAATCVLSLALSGLLAPTVAGGADPGVTPPEAEMLLDLDLLREADLTRRRPLLERMRLLESLRMLENLRFLEAAPDAEPARPGERRLEPR